MADQPILITVNVTDIFQKAAAGFPGISPQVLDQLAANYGHLIEMELEATVHDMATEYMHEIQDADCDINNHDIE